jgi:molybdate transport system ATP-binding protein
MTVPPMLDVRVQHPWSSGFELDVAFSSTAQSLALFGASGAGKSTILSCIAGLLRPKMGHVHVDGTVFLDTETGVFLPPRARRVGLVLQDAWLFPLLNVRRNLAYGQPRDDRRFEIEEVAERLEIAHLLGRRPRNLSGGERQRVALGRAILSEPRLLLCDEPMSALDAPRRDRLLPVFRAVCDELGMALVVVTHDRVVVDALADEVVHLDGGRVIGQSSTAG